MGTKLDNLINNSELASWFWDELYCPELSLDSFTAEISKHPLIHQLQDQFQYQFKNIENLMIALSHRSFIHEVKSFELQSYESLEFIGDSFLNYFVSKNLYKRLPQLSEGQWSKLRGAIVNTVSLHDIANFYGLPNYLLTGKGQVTNQETLKHKIYADLLESIVGAIVMDQDEISAWNFLERIFDKYQQEKEIDFWSKELLNNFDQKSQLQEILMQELKETPVYESVERDGKFFITCLIGNVVLGELSHTSKKVGQKELAKEILNNKELLLENIEIEKRGRENVK